MSLVRNHTGFHFYPLTSGSNDNPTYSQTAPTTFEMKNIPIFIGNLAYYVYGILLTFTGDVDQAASGSSLINYWQVVRSLIDSLEVRNAWHGTPVSSNHVKGSMLQVIEPIDCGYAMPQLLFSDIPAVDGDYFFEINIFVPLCIGQGAKPHQSAQLALFYKQAQLVINPAASSVLNGISAGAVFEGLAVRASAVMLPEPEIRLGPVGEWIDYQSSASSNQSQIALDSFGNVTGLSGTLPNAGVLWMGALTNYASSVPGSFALEDVTKYSFPFRGQVEIMQIPAFVAMQLLSMGGGDFAARGQAAKWTSLNGGVEGFPYDFTTGSAGANNSWKQLHGMLFFPMVTPSPDLELSKVQLAKGTQSYFLSGPTFSGTNHTLVKHVRTFDQNKRQDAYTQIVSSGLAKQVLGTDSNLGWVIKTLRKNTEIDADKARFLPQRLVPTAPKRVVARRAA